MRSSPAWTFQWLLEFIVFYLKVQPISTTSTCVVPSTNMVSWWTGDAGKPDLYGVNNPSAVNAVSIVPAKVSNGFMFGTKGYIDIPFSSSPGESEIHISGTGAIRQTRSE